MLSLGIIAALSLVCSGIQDSLSWIVDNLDQKKDLPSYAGRFSPADSLDTADPVSPQIRDGLNSGFP